MKKFLFSLVALMVSILSFAQTAVYTLDTSVDAAKGTNNAYASSGEVTVDGVTWNAAGNLTMAPWRIGGKSIEKTDRAVYTTTPVFGTVNQVVLTLGTSNLDLNSLKLFVADNASFTNAAEYTVESPVISGDNAINITAVKDGYFKFVFNVTVSGSSNKYVQFSKVVMNGEANATTVEAPVFDPAAGTYYGAAYVRATSATEGATIQYSLNDGEWTAWPAGVDAEHPAGVLISETSTLKAKAVKGSDESNVTTAKYVIGKEYANLAELVNVKPESQPVRVTLYNVAIDSIYTTKAGKRNGIYVNSGNESHSMVEIYSYDVPESWEVGGTVSGTIEGDWKNYNGTWEVCPKNWDGLTYTAAPALATVNIDDANKVKIQNTNYETLNVVNGTQKLSAGQYMVGPTADYKFNSVSLNGNVINPKYGTSYMVELAANDVLDITANYKEEAFGISFNDAAAIASVTTNGTNVELVSGGEGETAFCNAMVLPGYKVVVTLNEGYTTTNALAFYATDNVDFTTVAPTLATVTIDNAAKVNIMNENRENLNVVDGAQKLSAGNYIISSKVDNYLLAGVKINGKAVKPMTGAAYWMVELAAGDKVEISANYEEEAYGISFNDAAAIKSVTTTWNGGTELEIMTGGEGETVFASTAAPAGYFVEVALNEGYTSESTLKFYATEDAEVVTVAPALAVVTIDNAAKVNIMDENRENLTVVDGAQKLSAGNYMISSKVAGYMLAGVKINGKAVKPMTGAAYWMVELAAGDEVEINANYEEEAYGISFNDAAAIKSVTTTWNGGTELEIMTGGEGETVFAATAAPAGYYVEVALNEGYTSESTLKFYATQDVEVVTAAPALAVVNIDNAAKVKIMNTNYQNLTVVDGAQKLSAGQYMVMPNGDYLLASVKLNGETVKPMYGSSYMIELAANDVLDIAANWLDEDGEQALAVVTVNDLQAITSITAAGIDITEQCFPGGFDEDDNVTAYSYAVPMGERVVITTNADYNVTLDGAASTYGISFLANKEAYEVVATAKIMATVGTIGYGTAAFKQDVVPVSSNVKVYIVNGIEENDVTLTLKEVSVIPANTGVILAATEGKWEFTAAPADAVVSKPRLNLLKPAFKGESIAAGNYVLQDQTEKGNGFGFFALESARTAEKDCAYIKAFDSDAKALYFGDEATAIQSILSGNAEIYDLQGHKLNKLQKGINIVNGKKVMVK